MSIVEVVELLLSCYLAAFLPHVHHLKVARLLLSYRTAPPFIQYLLCCIFCFSLSVVCQPSSLLSNEVHHISVQYNCILRGSIAAVLQNVGYILYESLCPPCPQMVLQTCWCHMDEDGFMNLCEEYQETFSQV